MGVDQDRAQNRIAKREILAAKVPVEVFRFFQLMCAGIIVTRCDEVIFRHNGT
jgi:hypothetical protein